MDEPDKLVHRETYTFFLSESFLGFFTSRLRLSFEAIGFLRRSVRRSFIKKVNQNCVAPAAPKAGPIYG